MKKNFLHIIVFSFVLVIPIYVKTAAPSRSTLPEKYRYFLTCRDCGQTINRFDTEFSLHSNTCGKTTASDDSADVAQHPQSNKAPIIIVGPNQSNGNFSGHVLCPKDKCGFRCSINQPQHSYISFATLVIAAHLKRAHDID